MMKQHRLLPRPEQLTLVYQVLTTHVSWNAKDQQPAHHTSKTLDEPVDASGELPFGSSCRAGAAVSDEFCRCATAPELSPAPPPPPPPPLSAALPPGHLEAAKDTGTAAARCAASSPARSSACAQVPKP